MGLAKSSSQRLKGILLDYNALVSRNIHNLHNEILPKEEVVKDVDSSSSFSWATVSKMVHEKMAYSFGSLPPHCKYELLLIIQFEF